MRIPNTIIGALVGLFLAPFRPLGPWAGLLAASLATGLLMLFVFKKTSDQEGLRRAKNRIKAHLLELRLYKDSLGLSLRSQGSLLAANGRYLAHALRPMLVMTVPLVLLLAQLDAWFGAAPLRTGERTIVKIKLAKGRSALESGAKLTSPAGLTVETPPLRVEEQGEVDWRIRAESEGRHLLTVSLGGRDISKLVVVGGPALSKVPARRVRGFGDELLHPGEKPLPKDSPLESVEVVYPSARLNFLGLRIPWLVAFFVLSLAFGFGLKGVFKVEI
jgi:hypothetical protein